MPAPGKMITVGCIGRIISGETVIQPNVVVKSMRSINSGNGPTRYKLELTDGRSGISALLGTQNSHLVENNMLKENTLIQLSNYVPQSNGSTKYLILTGISIISQNVNANTAMKENVAPNRGTISSRPIQRVNNPNEIPIAGLNPYLPRWTIRCRVTARGPIRKWDKGPNNSGQLFSATLMDSEGMNIRATFFRDAVDKFYPLLQPDLVFNFSGGQVKLANPRFNDTKCNYEITFDTRANITPASDTSDIKQYNLTVTKLSELEPTDNKKLVDVVVSVISWDNIETGISKAGKEYTRMNIVVADSSNTKMKLTAFGDKCEELEKILVKGQNDAHVTNEGIILGIGNVRVSDYGGVSLTLINSSGIYVNPDVPETEELRQWASQVDIMTLVDKSGGSGVDGRTGVDCKVDERWDIDQLITPPEGCGDLSKGVYSVVKARLTFVRKENIWYPSTPEEGNNKKVILQPDGTYFCEANGKSYQECQWRYIANVKLTDDTGSVWATMFNEKAEEVFGVTAHELHQVREQSEASFESIINAALWQERLWKVRIKREMYNGEEKLRTTVVEAAEIEPEIESRMLLEYISKFD
eukprot:maker-scaffold_20-snap-gene-5.10-mRNA-1 protein AED:0.00 eAED:0.00 QI:75/1/1/1/1/1/3/39/584